METEIVIRGALAKKIITMAQDKGQTPEEFLTQLVMEAIEDPHERVKLYLELSEEYLREAKVMEEEGRITQASEKYWGAVASLLNAIGERRGWRHYTHRDYWEIIERIAEECKDPEVLTLFDSAEKLHANFYHGFLSPWGFKIRKEKCLMLVEKLRKYIAER